MKLALSAFAALALALGTLHAASPRVALEGAEPQSASSDVRFERLDVVLDPRGSSLAAWQVRIVDPSGRARIVGVEGGDDPAFAMPPFHDPRALSRGEIVLAAFDTTALGPASRTCVARLHVAVSGAAAPAFEVSLEVAASAAGPIAGATCELVP